MTHLAATTEFTDLPTRIVDTGGAQLRVVDVGEGPTVVLAHGFPELAYSWRHQIAPLVNAGYRVLVPDQRGYGGSSRPDAVESYDIEALTGDLVALLDDIGVEKAAFVGHDWGSMVVWQTALLHADRVAAVVGMSVPFLPRGPVSPVTAMRAVFADNFFYILYFQEPGVADAELGADPGRTMRRLLAGVTTAGEAPADLAAAFVNDGRGFVDRMPEPAGLPDWLRQDELDHYTAEFTRTGFTGGINWYRNFDRNWERTPQLDGARVTMPSLFIGGGADPVLVMSPPSTGHAQLDDHRGDVIVEGAGHWVQQEAADEVNRALLDFLSDTTPATATTQAGAS
ncbi:MAG: alpha/beta hydrolase [Ilumatobacteraceae bacterium]